MPDSESRRSALHHFAAVPHRAAGDKRFKARHYRVLMAICIAVNPATGHALISQRRMSQRANISRKYVAQAVPELEAWGYVTRVYRGRSKHGKFKTLIYAVHYDAQPPPRGASGGDTVHVTHVGDTTVSPTEAAESDSLNPDIQTGSDSAGADAQSAPRGRTSRTVAVSDETQLNGIQATNQAVSARVQEPIGPDEASIANTGSRLEMAISRADAFERDKCNTAEKRICEELFKAFPGDEAAAALEALNPELYELAVDAEMRQHGTGTSMVVRAIKKAIARTT